MAARSRSTSTRRGLINFTPARRSCCSARRHRREAMPDVVVTVPQSFGLDTWIAEGDLPGQSWSGEEWHFYLGGPVPNIKPGERVYVVYKGKLRGYAPLVRIERNGRGYALVRHNDAVAVTIDE